MALSIVTPPRQEPLSIDELKAQLRIPPAFTDDDVYLQRLILVVRSRAERATRRALITQTWNQFLDSWPTWNGYHGGRIAEPDRTQLPAGGWMWLAKAPLQYVTATVQGTTHGSTTVDGILSTGSLVVGMIVTSQTSDFAPLTTIAAIPDAHTVTLNQAALTSSAGVTVTASTVTVTYVDLNGVTQTWDPSNYLVDAPAGDYAARGRLSLGWVKIWPVIRPVANAVCIQMRCGYGDNETAVPELLKQAMLLDAGTLYDIRGSILAGNRAAAIQIPSTSQDIYRAFRSL